VRKINPGHKYLLSHIEKDQKTIVYTKVSGIRSITREIDTFTIVFRNSGLSLNCEILNYLEAIGCFRAWIFHDAGKTRNATHALPQCNLPVDGRQLGAERRTRSSRTREYWFSSRLRVRSARKRRGNDEAQAKKSRAMPRHAAPRRAIAIIATTQNNATFRSLSFGHWLLNCALASCQC